MARCAIVILVALAAVLAADAATVMPKADTATPKVSVDAGQVFAQAKKVIEEDPLDLQNAVPADYSGWANVLSQVLLKKEGHEDGASRALHRLLAETHEELIKIAEGSGETPMTALTDPALMDEYAGQDFSKKGGFAKPPTNIFGFITSKVFFNYAPCIFQSSATGVQVAGIGVNVQPSLVNIAPVLASMNAVGVNFAPSLITIVPSGILAVPAGINVQPSLAAILPTGLLVTPSGIMVTPQAAFIQPTGLYVGPAGTQVTPIDVAVIPRGSQSP